MAIPLFLIWMFGLAEPESPLNHLLWYSPTIADFPKLIGQIEDLTQGTEQLLCRTNFLYYNEPFNVQEMKQKGYFAEPGYRPENFGATPEMINWLGRYFINFRNTYNMDWHELKYTICPTVWKDADGNYHGV